MNEGQGGSFVVALEFGGSERCVAAVLTPGVPTRLALPAPITWPDGSHTDAIEILIQTKSEDEANSHSDEVLPERRVPNRLQYRWSVVAAGGLDGKGGERSARTPR